MSNNFIARASIIVNAAPSKVWEAFVNPEMIKQYMFGTNVTSDWKEGSSITWKGIWQGKEYEDKGTILKLEHEKILKYNHFSPLSGNADMPENYHTVRVELTRQKDKTLITLEQDNNPTEQAKEHYESNWKMMLETLKKFLEREN
jgi:uncharacterized protein YndB with AHSA1/START domain